MRFLIGWFWIMSSISETNLVVRTCSFICKYGAETAGQQGLRCSLTTVAGEHDANHVMDNQLKGSRYNSDHLELDNISTYVGLGRLHLIWEVIIRRHLRDLT